MSDFYLRFLGDEALRVVCKPVSGQFSIASGLLEAMRLVMRADNAAGLAANQVGGVQRVIIIGRGANEQVMINPRLTFLSPETEIASEGCMSIPKFFTTLRRHRQITVEFLDEGWANRSLTLGGFDARCVQHEIDHLDGKLIVDGLPRQQRRQAERLVAKAVA
jgi:peptide deformylase